MRYIDDHLSDKLRVGDIARQVYVHPDYLSARFKQETGEGISRYIQRRRVQEACRFLRYSACLLYPSDAAYDLLCVDLGGRRII